jgi:hypothetical protein
LDEVVFILFLYYITVTCRHTIVFYGNYCFSNIKMSSSACNIWTFSRRFSRTLTPRAPKNTLTVVVFYLLLLPGYWGRFKGLSMLLLKWIKIVWSKRSRCVLGTIQHILKKSLKIPQGQSESVYAFCHVHKLLFAWLTDNIHHIVF